MRVCNRVLARTITFAAVVALQTVMATATPTSLSWQLSVVYGESCATTCAFYGLGCVEGAFPSTICQGKYVQATSPQLAWAFAGTTTICDGIGLFDENTTCPYYAN